MQPKQLLLSLHIFNHAFHKGDIASVPVVRPRTKVRTNESKHETFGAGSIALSYRETRPDTGARLVAPGATRSSIDAEERVKAANVH